MEKAQVENIVKAIVVFGVSALLVKAFMPKPRKSKEKGHLAVVEVDIIDRPKIAPPPPMDELQAQENPKSAEAHLALSVYIDALNGGSSNEKLEKVNEELKNDLGLKVYRRRSDDKLVVSDLNDVDIMEYDAPSAVVA